MSTKKKRTLFIRGIMLLFALCIFLCSIMVGKTTQLRSDSRGVEFVTEGGASNLLKREGNVSLHIYRCERS